MGQKRNGKPHGVQNQREESDGKPKLKRKEYEEQIAWFHAELVKVQFWVKHTGARIIVLFEGRDAAGKGGLSRKDHRQFPARRSSREGARHCDLGAR
jgi:polyphosphate kinase 2 (PPK2 family)